MADCSAEELERLMTLRGEDAVDRIHSDFGGITRLCERLRTDVVNGQSLPLHPSKIVGLPPAML